MHADCACVRVCLCVGVVAYVRACVYVCVRACMNVLPSILIAVCVPMSSHFDFYGMCAQHLVAFVGGNNVIFFYEGSL